MTFNGWLQIAIYCRSGDPDHQAVRRLHDARLRRASARRCRWCCVLSRRGIYRLCGVNEREEQHWMSYAIAMLAFSFAGFVVMYALQRLQNVLPFNPQDQSRGRARPRLQHLGQLRHQHELAVATCPRRR